MKHVSTTTAASYRSMCAMMQDLPSAVRLRDFVQGSLREYLGSGTPHMFDMTRGAFEHAKTDMARSDIFRNYTIAQTRLRNGYPEFLHLGPQPAHANPLIPKPKSSAPISAPLSPQTLNPKTQTLKPPKPEIASFKSLYTPSNGPKETLNPHTAGRLQLARRTVS